MAAYHLKYDEDACDALFSKARFGEEDAPSGFHFLFATGYGIQSQREARAIHNARSHEGSYAGDL